jgi:hypothetical protein
MPIVEDDVKRAMDAWLKGNGYLSVQARLGTRQGYDVEGVHPSTNNRLVVECKGEAQTGDQHSRSWGNVASALLTSLNEAEDPSNKHDVGIALPDTNEYRGRMAMLQKFCEKQSIAVFWVSENGTVLQW